MTVRQSEVGGHRFASFEAGEEPTFEDLKSAGLKYYFPLGKNHFHEKASDMVITVLDSSGVDLDITQPISKYLDERGLTPSRVYFVLSTSPLCDSDDCDSDDDQLKAALPDKKICDVCGRTYTYMCIMCIQDKEFQESLSCDKRKSNQNLQDSNKANQSFKDSERSDQKLEDRENANIDHSDGPSENEIKPDQNTLRQLRIKAITKTQDMDHSSLADAMRKLSEEFLNKEIDSCVTFNIRRRYVFVDVIKKMKIFFADKHLSRFKVEFTSASSKEAAVDTGGPGRELVTLFYDKVTGQLLHGEPKSQVFVHDLLKVGSGDYFTFGKFVALALLHGYDPPHQLCKGLSAYISG